MKKMRPYSSIGQLICVFSGCLLFAALAVAAKCFFSSFIFNELRLNLPLSPNATNGVTSYSIWKDIPFPIINKFYLFHVENPLEVVELGEKPILTQVGPFTYHQRRHKVNVQFSTNRSTVSYKEVSSFHFNANQSQHLSNRTIRVLNAALLTVLNQAENYPAFVCLLLDRLITVTKSALFVERTVHELLWGYEDPLLVELKNMLPDKIPFTTVGWFIKQNGTDQGSFAVFTGADGNLTRFLDLITWKKSSRMNLWPPGKDSPCNSFDGASDGSAFGPYVGKEERLRTFTPRLCRGAFDSVFEREETFRDVWMLRFHMDKQTFGNATTNPSNACFCSSATNDSSIICPPDGTLNITACSFGAPVFLSQPHFLNADPALGSRVKGLLPSPELHDSFFYIEPTTGINVDAKGRLQLNGFVKNLPGFPKIFKHIGDNLVFPVMWVEEEARMDDRTFNSIIKSRVIDKIRLVDAAVGLLAAFAIFALFSTILMMGQRCHFKRKCDISRERLVPIHSENSSQSS